MPTVQPGVQRSNEWVNVIPSWKWAETPAGTQSGQTEEATLKSGKENRCWSCIYLFIYWTFFVFPLPLHLCTVFWSYRTGKCHEIDGNVLGVAVSYGLSSQDTEGCSCRGVQKEKLKERISRTAWSAPFFCILLKRWKSLPAFTRILHYEPKISASVELKWSKYTLLLWFAHINRTKPQWKVRWWSNKPVSAANRDSNLVTKRW